MRSRLACFLLLGFVTFLQAQTLPSNPPHDGSAIKDVIFIMSLTPTAVVEEEEVEMVATVTYELRSAETASIDLNFNLRSAQGMSSVDSVVVKNGKGTVTLKARLAPRLWSDTIAFKAMASLSRVDEKLMRRMIASDEVKIPVAKSDRSTAARSTPVPEKTFENGIKIVAIAPDNLREGITTEITVTVNYELLSREEGIISLGSSAGRSTGYEIIGNTRVKMGKGTAVVTAKLVPQKTNGLPFGKIHVGLSEYPHPKRWTPLAIDALTIPVE
ncbi:MAG TPA: hypothetical protein PLN52_12470 [Opitutaceae bacterium]|nr:hypothetical protein [Opitutaceae bacterium]